MKRIILATLLFWSERKAFFDGHRFSDVQLFSLKTAIESLDSFLQELLVFLCDTPDRGRCSLTTVDFGFLAVVSE